MSWRKFLMRFGATLVIAVLMSALLKTDITISSALIHIGGSVFWAALFTDKQT